MAEHFGIILKEWRKVRRFSQLDLSLEAEISTRHLSFLETGRAQPSRDMVLRLARTLDMPRGSANQALNAAGFAPAFPDLAPDAAELAPVRQAITMMLKHHAPFPGIAIDRHWKIVEANDGAAMLLAAAAPDEDISLVDMLVDSADSGFIENWEEVALLSVARLRTEILAYGGDEVLQQHVARITALERYKAANLNAVNFNQAVLPTIFRLGELRLSLFSTIAEFGTVQDIRAGEVRVELFFPADEASVSILKV